MVRQGAVPALVAPPREQRLARGLRAICAELGLDPPGLGCSAMSTTRCSNWRGIRL